MYIEKRCGEKKSKFSRVKNILQKHKPDSLFKINKKSK